MMAAGGSAATIAPFSNGDDPTLNGLVVRVTVAETEVEVSLDKKLAAERDQRTSFDVEVGLSAGLKVDDLQEGNIDPADLGLRGKLGLVGSVAPFDDPTWLLTARAELEFDAEKPSRPTAGLAFELTRDRWILSIVLARLTYRSADDEFILGGPLDNGGNDIKAGITFRFSGRCVPAGGAGVLGCEFDTLNVAGTTAPVPVPASVAFVPVGLAALFALGRRRRLAQRAA